MFKTLISTFLLCSAVGTGAIKVNPNKSSTLHTLNGTYVFRDNFDYEVIEDFDNYEIDDTTGSYQFSFSDLSNRPYCLYYYYVNGGYQYQYDWVDNINVTVNGVVNIAVAFGRSETTQNYSFDWDESLAYDSPMWIREFQIFFNVEFSMSEDSYQLFNAIFTNSGNAYNHFYNGYYTFTTSNVSSKQPFVVLGNNLYDNRLGFLLTHDRLSLSDVYVFSFTGVTAESSTQSYLIQNNQLVGKNFVLLSNCLLNDNMKSRMLSCGVFSYVYDSTNYDFEDLMVSIADTPVHFLRSLFSFKLFGIELYIAFASVLTLVLIALVIKKII